MNFIRVNGLIINSELIGCLQRRQFSNQSGLVIRFAAGGRVWVPDPDAKQVETAYKEWLDEQSTSR